MDDISQIGRASGVPPGRDADKRIFLNHQCQSPASSMLRAHHDAMSLQIPARIVILNRIFHQTALYWPRCSSSLRCSAAQRTPACRLKPWALAHKGCVIGSARCVLQAQHFASRPRPERDAVSAGGRLQRREQVIGIDGSVCISHISHALFFDQVPLAPIRL